ncbi:MAG: hypothetical protein ACHBN1_29285 [Heteroscytonema crispum UTEX LB 1556]
MRIIFETDNTDREDKSLIAKDVNEPHTSIDDGLIASCKYAFASFFLVMLIVIAPVSNWLDSLILVQQVRQLVNPQSVQLETGSLANRVYQALLRKGYRVFTNPGEVNIIYLRGADKNAKPNGNAINEWSDRRLILSFRNGQPTIIGNWAATVKPGTPAIRNPLNKTGAAFIEPGQYQAWRVDTHHGIFGRLEEGLIQIAPVSFRRDINRDGNVDGESLQSGMIGLNQHSGSNQLKVDQASYACLAGQSESGHLHGFMPLVKSDPRYRRNRGFLFTTTILDVSDL